ncbi:MAG: ATP-binding cassette domain-containing protein [Actinomycetes bacterium]
MADLSGPTLRVESLTKRFRRSVTAVRDLSFTVQPGRVTGFLGPNGSGKTTTLRCLLALVRPTAGQALVDGTPYPRLADPLRTVGAALEASSFHPGRTGRNHLRVVAAAAGLPSRRADEVLEQVGLSAAANRRTVEYSLGMRQRLALATALLGEPGALVLDEPANGLDPEGIAWLRGFLRDRAARGGTVLVSSHVLAEVQQTVDDVVIINHGALVHAGPLSGLTRVRPVLVRSPQADQLAALLRSTRPDIAIDERPDGALRVRGLESDEIGHLAFTAGCEVHELSREPDDLERVFLELTADGPPGGAGR